MAQFDKSSYTLLLMSTRYEAQAEKSSLRNLYDLSLPELTELLAEAGCFVVPTDVRDKATISQNLIEQGCAVDIAHATKGEDVIAVLAQKVAVDFDSKTAVKK